MRREKSRVQTMGCGPHQSNWTRHATDSSYHHIISTEEEMRSGLVRCRFRTRPLLESRLLCSPLGYHTPPICSPCTCGMYSQPRQASTTLCSERHIPRPKSGSVQSLQSRLLPLHSGACNVMRAAIWTKRNMNGIHHRQKCIVIALSTSVW